MRSILREIVKMKNCYLLLLPTFVLLFIFEYYPAFSAIYHSFFDWDGFTLPKYVGLGNFIQLLLKDPVMSISAKNITILTLFRIIIAITIPLIAAELVFDIFNMKMAYIYRTLFVIPMVVPSMVNLLVWKFVYNPQYGLLNQFLKVIGLQNLCKAWLGDFSTALYAILFVGFPWISSLWFLIFLAGLQNISPDIFDAAKIDGVTGLNRIRFIDIPLIVGQLKLILILSTINALQGYVGIMVLTNGGPGNSTMVPGLYLYNNAFYFNKMGYACSIGVILFSVLLLLTYVNLKYIRSSEEG
jgi:raffinose/stachyose/melibiose transport system permease protein